LTVKARNDIQKIKKYEKKMSGVIELKKTLPLVHSPSSTENIALRVRLTAETGTETVSACAGKG
jgi:hypothetical protein